jgi:hypothetical protein
VTATSALTESCGRDDRDLAATGVIGVIQAYLSTQVGQSVM